MLLPRLLVPLLSMARRLCRICSQALGTLLMAIRKMGGGPRFAGTAIVVERGDGTFAALLGHFRGALAAAHARHRDDHGDQGAAPDLASV
jgi:hypothetical protein